MIKRIMICTLCFVLCFSLCAFADEAAVQQPMQQQQAPQHGNMPQQGVNMRDPADGSGAFTGEARPVEGEQPPEVEMPDNGNMPTMPQNGENTQVADGENVERQWGGMPGDRGFVPPGMEQETIETQTDTPTTFTGVIKEYFTPILSVILLALAFVFVIFYKRKKY